CVFFFQAEDGIRDFHVTGVQTCALPISANDSRVNIRLLLDAQGAAPLAPRLGEASDDVLAARVPFDLYALHAAEAEAPVTSDPRSEERRVGKEGRSRLSCQP